MIWGLVRYFRRVPVGASALAVLAMSLTASPVTAGSALGPWRAVAAPPVPRSQSANLTALAMAGPSEGWASGFTLANTANAPFEPLLAAWNGCRWITLHLTLGAGGGRLDGLAAQSADDAWAVGTAYPAANSAQGLIEHWDGRRWTRVSAAGVPGYPFVSLLGVAAGSAADAWAVGEAQRAARPGLIPVIEHWDGRDWRLAANPPVPPMTALTAVTIGPDGKAWAVGAPFASTGHGVVLQWTGQHWVTAPTPRSGGTVILSGVIAVSANSVWAVGSASVRDGPFRPYALHWNGRHWLLARVPHRGEGNADWGFESVTSLGHGSVIAVGSDNTGRPPGRALYGIWNGQAWSVGTLPRLTQFNGVSFDGRRTVWAVGSVQTSGQAFRPVVRKAQLHRTAEAAAARIQPRARRTPESQARAPRHADRPRAGLHRDKNPDVQRGPGRHRYFHRAGDSRSRLT